MYNIYAQIFDIFIMYYISRYYRKLTFSIKISHGISLVSEPLKQHFKVISKKMNLEIIVEQYTMDEIKMVAGYEAKTNQIESTRSQWLTETK